MASLLILFILAALSGRAQGLEVEARALRPADTSAQQAAVLDDLEQRARAVLERLPRAGTRAEAEKARPRLRRLLEE